MRVVIFTIFLVAISTFATKAQFSVQKALIEVFTGSWVQYAPDGAVKLETALADNSGAYAVNIHNSDAMENSDGIDIYNFYSPAFPQALINRSGTLFSRSIWSSSTTSALLGAAYVTVTFDSVRFDTISRQLDVYMSAYFTGPVTGDMRFNCIVVEDSVTGTGSGYNQVNSDNTTPGHPYYQAGNPIIGFQHRYVARDYLGGAWGVSGSVPPSVSFGTVSSYHFSTVVNAAWNEDQISLIGMISRYDGNTLTDREIMNVEKCFSILPPKVAIGANTNLVCQGGSITYNNLSTNYGDSYYWEFEGGNPATSTLQNPGAIQYAVAGNYLTTLQVSSLAGTASSSLGVSIIGVNTQVSLTDTSLISNAVGAQYRWFDCSSGYTLIPGETSQEIILDGIDHLAVEVTQGACKDTSDCIDVLTFSLNDDESPLFQVFPNPSSGEFIVVTTEFCQLNVCSVSGQFIATRHLDLGENKLDLDLASGIYFLNFITSTSTKSLKLVVE